MAFSNGTYSRVMNWAADKLNSIKITASRVDTEADDMATALSTCLLKDGTQTVTANLPMATFKFTGLGAGSAATDSINFGTAQAQAYLWGGTSGGSGTVMTISVTPAITAYAAGQTFRFIAGFVTTGVATLNVNGLGAKNIKKQGQSGLINLGTGDMAAGYTYSVTYDGTQFIVSPSPFMAVVCWDGDGALGATYGAVGSTFTSPTRNSTGVYRATVVSGDDTILATMAPFATVHNDGSATLLFVKDVTVNTVSHYVEVKTCIADGTLTNVDATGIISLMFVGR